MAVVAAADGARAAAAAGDRLGVACGRQAALLGAAFGDGDVLGVARPRARRSSPSSSRCSASATCWSGWSGASARGVWRRTEGRPGPPRRWPLLLAAALVAGLGWAWWPVDDRYRPVRAWEGGTVLDAVPAVQQQPRSAAGSQGDGGHDLAGGRRPAAHRGRPGAGHGAGAGVAGRRRRRERPADGGGGRRRRRRPGSSRSTARCRPGRGTTRRSRSTPRTARCATTSPSPSSGPTRTPPSTATRPTRWPAAATAARSRSPSRSCSLVGSVDVVVPQNLAAAVNYACLECVTYALATQLVVSLPGPLSDGGQAELAAIWAELQAFGEQIEDVPLAELRDRLTEFEARILDVVRESTPETDSRTAAPRRPAPPTTGPPTRAPRGRRHLRRRHGRGRGTADGDPATSTGSPGSAGGGDGRVDRVGRAHGRRRRSGSVGAGAATDVGPRGGQHRRGRHDRPGEPAGLNATAGAAAKDRGSGRTDCATWDVCRARSPPGAGGSRRWSRTPTSRSSGTCSGAPTRRPPTTSSATSCWCCGGGSTTCPPTPPWRGRTAWPAAAWRTTGAAPSVRSAWCCGWPGNAGPGEPGAGRGARRGDAAPCPRRDRELLRLWAWEQLATARDRPDPGRQRERGEHPAAPREAEAQGTAAGAKGRRRRRTFRSARGRRCAAMTDMPDDDLRARLSRLDPAPAGVPVDPVTSPRAQELVERAMSTPVQTPDTPSARRRARLGGAGPGCSPRPRRRSSSPRRRRLPRPGERRRDPAPATGSPPPSRWSSRPATWRCRASSSTCSSSARCRSRSPAR